MNKPTKTIKQLKAEQKNRPKNRGNVIGLPYDELKIIKVKSKPSYNALNKCYAGHYESKR